MAPRILLVRMSSLGDILLTTPLVRAIRTRHPDAWISYVTKTAFTPLLADNPRIDELIPYDPTQPLGTLIERLKAGQYTHRLDLHGSLRSRILRLRVPGKWHGYPKHRVART
ncbi:MAG: glycosyltransferase family 9 protein, partial [Gemmatimonadales bacterium]